MSLTDKETVDASLLGVELEVEIDWQVQHVGIVNNRQDDTAQMLMQATRLWMLHKRETMHERESAPAHLEEQRRRPWGRPYLEGHLHSEGWVQERGTGYQVGPDPSSRCPRGQIWTSPPAWTSQLVEGRCDDHGLAGGTWSTFLLFALDIPLVTWG